MHRAIPAALAVLLLSTLPAGAHAATHCVDTPAELQAAIDAAEANGEADEIRIVNGTYEPSQAFHFQSEEAFSIAFRGGYEGGCLVRSGATTTIDGANQRRGLMVINHNGDTTVEGLGFVRGLSTNNRGGGLRILTDVGDVQVDSNTFIANRADDFGGALAVTLTSGSLRVRNNLAFANSSANIGAFELLINEGEAHVTGNTIVANLSEGDFLPGGLWIGGAGYFTLANNIIWNNLAEEPGPFHCDFRSAANHERHANDIGVVSPFSTEGEVGSEFSVDPQFADCGFLCVGFELERGSPLVDAGVDDPAGGMTATDLARKPRTIGPHVDIGAYENDALFADGFE